MTEEQGFLNKTKDEIRQEIHTLCLREMGLENRRPTGVLWGFLEVLTLVTHGLYQRVLNQVFAQADPEKAQDFWLDLWGLQSGLKRESPRKAAGRATVKAYASGTIPKGTLMSLPGTDIRFLSAEELSFQARDFLLPIEAEKPGSLYNVPPGTSLHLGKVVFGVERVSLKEGWISQEGRENERDEDFRNRIKLRWSSLGDGVPPAKFELLALAVPEVKEAKVIRTPRGQGTIDLYITTTTGEVSQGLIGKVQEAIYQSSLVCRDMRRPPP